jgi:hypothetical protein
MNASGYLLDVPNYETLSKEEQGGRWILLLERVRSRKNQQRHQRKRSWVSIWILSFNRQKTTSSEICGPMECCSGNEDELSICMRHKKTQIEEQHKESQGY